MIGKPPAVVRGLAVVDAIVGNALPVVGILALHWDLLVVVFYYLLAEFVRGLVALAEIARCRHVSPERRPWTAREDSDAPVPSRTRFLSRTGWIVFLEAIVLYAMSDGVRESQGGWILIAVVLLAGQGLVAWLRFVHGGRWDLVTCAEVEVDYLGGFALFLGMVVIVAGLAALGLSGHAAATVAVLLLILALGAADVWRALGRESRLLEAAHDYAVHLATVDAGVRPEAD